MLSPQTTDTKKSAESQADSTAHDAQRRAGFCGQGSFKRLIRAALRRTIHNELLALVSICVLGSIALMAHVDHELENLSELSQLINLAGRVRMLSQQNALLSATATRQATHQATQATEATEALAAGRRALDETIITLRSGQYPVQSIKHASLLEDVAQAWSAQKALSDIAVAQAQSLSSEQTSELVAAASTTLNAAQKNVDVLLSHAEASRNAIRRAQIVAGIFGLLVIFTALIYVRQRIMRPLKTVAGALDRLGQGELSTRIPQRHDDEIGQLVAHVNVSAERLEQAHNDIEHALDQMRDSETRHRTLWETSAEAIITLDIHSIIRFANPAVRRVFGYAPEALVGQDIGILQPEHLRAGHRHGFASYLTSDQRTLDWTCIEITAAHCSGEVFPVELSFSEMRLQGERWFVGTFRDITERKRQEAALQYSANYDALTGLPNRTLLFDRIDQAISHAKRLGRSVGVLYVDLDNFKVINDSLGHESGDELLREAGRRMLTCVRDGDTVARIGGDEFAVLLSDLADEGDIDQVAQRSLAAMARVFHVGGSEGFVGASIGASVFPHDGKSRAELLQHADIAMYRAKEYGRNNYQRFAEHMQARYKLRLSMEAQLRRAVESNELVLHYQPQIDLATGKVIGAEALVRWESPSLGRVSPVQFIPLAEETGLIVSIGEWIIQRACRDAAAWAHTEAGADCMVAINLSARQFSDSNLIDAIAAELANNALPASRVEMEITESLVMDNPEKASATLRAIKKMGCHVALDDFGTGYSSLAYLRHFPMDVLKIDKSLIQDVAIVRAVIQLARSFGLRTLAEGVEDEATLVMLRHLGCDIIQGYYYSKPLPLPEFMHFLENHNASTTGVPGA